jgi:hypothetical protein
LSRKRTVEEPVPNWKKSTPSLYLTPDLVRHDRHVERAIDVVHADRSALPAVEVIDPFR